MNFFFQSMVLLESFELSKFSNIFRSYQTFPLFSLSPICQHWWENLFAELKILFVLLECNFEISKSVPHSINWVLVDWRAQSSDKWPNFQFSHRITWMHTSHISIRTMTKCREIRTLTLCESFRTQKTCAVEGKREHVHQNVEIQPQIMKNVVRWFSLDFVMFLIKTFWCGVVERKSFFIPLYFCTVLPFEMFTSFVHDLENFICNCVDEAGGWRMHDGAREGLQRNFVQNYRITQL